MVEDDIKLCKTYNKWVPATTAWRVLRLRMEDRLPSDMEGSCE